MGKKKINYRIKKTNIIISTYSSKIILGRLKYDNEINNPILITKNKKLRRTFNKILKNGFNTLTAGKGYMEDAVLHVKIFDMNKLCYLDEAFGNHGYRLNWDLEKESIKQ